MIPSRRLTASNPLIQRVLRHAAMTTLFRTEDRIPRASIAPSGSGPFIQAAPAPHSPITGPKVEPDWSSGVAATSSLRPTTDSLPGDDPPPARPASAASAPGARRSDQANQPASSPRQKDLPASTASDTARSEEEADTEDANWPRLQTILRKHEAKRAAVEQATEPTVETVVDQRLATASPRIADAPTPEKESVVRREAKTAPVQRQQQETSTQFQSGPTGASPSGARQPSNVADPAERVEPETPRSPETGDPDQVTVATPSAPRHSSPPMAPTGPDDAGQGPAIATDQTSTEPQAQPAERREPEAPFRPETGGPDQVTTAIPPSLIQSSAATVPTDVSDSDPAATAATDRAPAEPQAPPAQKVEPATPHGPETSSPHQTTAATPSTPRDLSPPAAPTGPHDVGQAAATTPAPAPIEPQVQPTAMAHPDAPVKAKGVDAGQVAATPSPLRPVADAEPGIAQERHEASTANRQEAQPGIVTMDQSLEASTSLPASTASVPIQREPGAQPTVGSVEPAGETPVNIPEVSPVGDVARSQPDSLEVPVPIAEQDEQPLPLETVWPVQVNRPIQRQPSTGPSQAVTAAFHEAGEGSSSRDDTDTAKVEATLGKVTPGRPSDSSIELIPPRGRKPGSRAMAASQAAPDAPAAPVEPPGPGSAAQRRPTEMGEEDRARPPHSSPAKSAIQRQARAPETPEPATIATEIGPLPADLWQLLGRTPPPSPETRPVEAEATPPASVQTQSSDMPAEGDKIAPVDSPDASVQRVLSRLSGLDASDARERLSGAVEEGRSEVPATTASAIAAAERSAAAEAESAQDTAGQVASGVVGAASSWAETTTEEAGVTSFIRQMEDTTTQGEQSDEDEQTGSDLDNLARLVYQEIRRRLTLEKERGRSRF